MGSRTPVIRDARPGDVERMVALLGRLFAIETDFEIDPARQRDGLNALLADEGRSTVKVAELHGGTVGMCTAQLAISTAAGGFRATVEDLIVEPDCRRRGIGTALLAAVGKWAGDNGAVSLQLLADSRNGRALDFYRHKHWFLTRMICLRRETASPADTAGPAAGGTGKEVQHAS